MNTENFKTYQSYSQEVKARLTKHANKDECFDLPLNRASQRFYTKSEMDSEKLSFKQSLLNKFHRVADKINYFIDWLKGENFSVQDDSVLFYSLGRGVRRDMLRKGVAVKMEGGAIILMSNLVVIRTLIAVMKLKGTRANKAAQCVKIINTAKGSIYCSIPLATINILLGLADAYGKSKAGNVQSTWLNLNNGMKGLMNTFQQFANNNPEKARAAILSGGFSIKKISLRQPQKWSVKNNPNQGVLDLTAGGSGSYTCHTWWISYDGKVFEQFDTTMDASTQVHGLASNITVYFMHQVIGKNGPMGFDMVIRISVD